MESVQSQGSQSPKSGSKPSPGQPSESSSKPEDSVAARRGITQFAVVSGVALGVVLLDQLSKWWAVENLHDHNIDVFWTLRFRLIGNRGSAFSLGTGLGPLFAVAAIVVAVVLLMMGRKAPTRTGAVALGLVLGGAVGNLVDRIFRDGEGIFGGYVVDFIDFQWWPVFNVADMAIVCGAFLIVAVGSRGWDGARS